MQPGSRENSSVIVGDMDLVAQAALLVSLKERTTITTSASSQEEAGDIMEPVQMSKTDPDNIVIVGEIVGPQIAPPKSTLEEDTHPAASEATAVDPKLECGESGDLIGQTAQEPIDEKVDDTCIPVGIYGIHNGNLLKSHLGGHICSKIC